MCGNTHTFPTVTLQTPLVHITLITSAKGKAGLTINKSFLVKSAPSLHASRRLCALWPGSLLWPAFSLHIQTAFEELRRRQTALPNASGLYILFICALRRSTEIVTSQPEMMMVDISRPCQVHIPNVVERRECYAASIRGGDTEKADHVQ